jgi:hypothetical protein
VRAEDGTEVETPLLKRLVLGAQPGQIWYLLFELMRLLPGLPGLPSKLKEKDVALQIPAVRAERRRVWSSLWVIRGGRFNKTTRSRMQLHQPPRTTALSRHERLTLLTVDSAVIAVDDIGHA